MKTIAWRLATWVTLLIAVSCSDRPRASAPAAERVGATSQALTTIPGDFVATPPSVGAIDIGVGAGDPWMLQLDGTPAQYTGTSASRAWTHRPAVSDGVTSIAIAVSPEGKAWRITSGNIVQYYDPPSDQWKALSTPSCAQDIGAGAHDQVWVIGCDPQGGGFGIYYLTGSSQPDGGAGSPAWHQVSGSAVRIAVSPEGIPWVITSTHFIFQWNGTQFVNVNGQALDIGVGPNNTPWVVGGDNNAYMWNGTQFTGPVSTVPIQKISVGADGTPWAIGLTSGRALRWGAPWKWVGASGVVSGGTDNTWAGDIEDIDTSVFASQNRILVGTGGGGVWFMNSVTSTPTWTPIADTGFNPGPSPQVSSVALKPDDPNTVLVGTGVYANQEPLLGNGIWRGILTPCPTCTPTTGSWAWQQSKCGSGGGPTNGCPTNVKKLRFSKTNTQLAWAATSNGFFYSQDAGQTFSLASSVTAQNGTVDFAVNDAVTPPRVYAATWATGIEISIDGGQNFTTTTLPAAVPAASFQFVKMALAPSNANKMYVTIDAGTFQGVFVSSNMNQGSPTWTATGLGPCLDNQGGVEDDWMRSQGGHDGAIAVSPTIGGNIAIAAGVKPWRTADGGGPPFNPNALCPPNGGPPIADWTLAGTSFHADTHVIAFADESNVFLGTDGGLAISTDGGVTWVTAKNTIPVMNSTSVSVYGDTILEASWDVGCHSSTDHGSSWQSSTRQDNDCSFVFAANNNDWFAVNNGAMFEATAQTNWDTTPCPQGGNVGKSFVQSGGLVYTGGSDTWDGLWRMDESGGAAQHLTPGLPATGFYPQKVAAATLNGDTYFLAAGFQAGPGMNVQMLDSSTLGGGKAWEEMGGSVTNMIGAASFLAVGQAAVPIVYVLTVDAAGTTRIYADDMNDLATAYANVVRSNTVQPAWIDITGNLPQNIGSNGIIADGARGTAFFHSLAGVYKTSNSCVSSVVASNHATSCWPTVWQPWGDGLPVHPPSVAGAAVATGVTVNQLDAQTRSDGRFYIYASVWGRGVWVRDAASDDP